MLQTRLLTVRGMVMEIRPLPKGTYAHGLGHVQAQGLKKWRTGQGALRKLTKTIGNAATTGKQTGKQTGL